MELKKGVIFSFVLIFLLSNFFSFVSSYDSGWQNWRTNNNHIVCGGKRSSCSNSLLGVDWFQTIPDHSYGIICGEYLGPFGCLHWGGASIGRNFPLSNGVYYLLIKNYFDNNGPEDGETFQAGISDSFGSNGRNGADLGGGYKVCVFSRSFFGGKNSKVWIKGTGNSFDSVQFRITSCIPNEAGLVYCENGQPAVSNCQPYCIPFLVNTSWSDWQKISCVGNQTQERRERVEYDKNNCGTFQNKTYYEYRLVGPSYVNTSWSSWEDIGCSGANLLQVRNLTQYDLFNCAPSQIFYEYRTIKANIVFSLWSDWQSLQCINSTHRNQSKYRIEYDSNNLGCFQNKTHYEYRIIEDFSCGGQINIPIINIFQPINNSIINSNIVLFNGSSNQVVNWTLYLNGTIVYLLNNSRNVLGNLSLSNNYYNLTFCGININGSSCSSVFFFVNASSDQNMGELYLRIISPENKTYSNSLILVNLSSNGNSFWYNWNGTNVSYFGPIFVNFSSGQIVLHAWATNGTNLVYKNVSFFVEEPESKKDENKKTASSRSSKRRMENIEDFENGTNKISYTIEKFDDKIFLGQKEEKMAFSYNNINLILFIAIILLILLIVLVILLRW
ncbi:MAG: hypothetical protein QXX68_00470 [Candidatus Pacearchaeota archaeon]